MAVKRPGGYGGFQNDSQSPGQGLSGGILDRTITPGPFDAERRPSTAAERSFPRRKESLDVTNRNIDRSEAANTIISAANAASNSAPKQPRKNGYGGFGAPLKVGEDSESNRLGPPNRSETFPKPTYLKDPPVRKSSAPAPRHDLLRQNSALEDTSRPSMVPDTSRLPPPRTSLIRPATAGKGAGVVDLAAEFGVGNPYHTPSDSASSGYSNFSSHLSQTSFQTSPARSQANSKQSNSTNMDDLMNELQHSMGDLRAAEPIAEPVGRAANRTPSPLAESPLNMSPKALLNSAARPIGDQTAPRRHPNPFIERDLVQLGVPSVPDQSFAASPPSPRTMPPLRKASTDPGRPRGDCKACRLPISGKSISSADGRLTGKYHKACFVCTTCSEPFTSAEFYVHNDQPYCEQHYHQLNGSLCGSCGRGIEGQYLEDEVLMKYHVGCFRCLDCGQSLSEGYFDVDGRSYCEPHAIRRIQSTWQSSQQLQQPPSGSIVPPPRSSARPSYAAGAAGRPGPRPGPGMPRSGYGVQPGSRLAPNVMPRMNKRMTRLGMM